MQSRTELIEFWHKVQGAKPHMPHFLRSISLMGIRGIADLTVNLEYPVTVIGGANLSGKTTVLFAAGCAYSDPSPESKSLQPRVLFRGYHPGYGNHSDELCSVDLTFTYHTPQGPRIMAWRRSKGKWRRNFAGAKGTSQPERLVYLRRISDLRSVSEVREIRNLDRQKSPPKQSQMPGWEREAAERMLGVEYSKVVFLSSGNHDMLFAHQKSGAKYSELHMAAGERTILRLLTDVAYLKNALILIDEVEAGLHPQLQRLLMMKLQELALLRNHQIIVTTQSNLVLDTVPQYGRIFLNRESDGNVAVLPPYRDAMLSLLYGTPGTVLTILCEDEEAEQVVRGIATALPPPLLLSEHSIRITRDAGKDQFPVHAEVLRKFGLIGHTAFVVDGDGRGSTLRQKIQFAARAEVPVWFLPGNGSPEEWVWSKLKGYTEPEFRKLGKGKRDLADNYERLENVYIDPDKRPSEVAKTKLRVFAAECGREPAEICRLVAHREVENNSDDARTLLSDIETYIGNRRLTT